MAMLFLHFSLYVSQTRVKLHVSQTHDASGLSRLLLRLAMGSFLGFAIGPRLVAIIEGPAGYL